MFKLHVARKEKLWLLFDQNFYVHHKYATQGAQLTATLRGVLNWRLTAEVAVKCAGRRRDRWKIVGPLTGG